MLSGRRNRNHCHRTDNSYLTHYNYSYKNKRNNSIEDSSSDKYHSTSNQKRKPRNSLMFALLIIYIDMYILGSITELADATPIGNAGGGPPDPNVSNIKNCDPSDRDCMEKNFRLVWIQRMILQGLNMTKAPNTTGMTFPPVPGMLPPGPGAPGSGGGGGGGGDDRGRVSQSRSAIYTEYTAEKATSNDSTPVSNIIQFQLKRLGSKVEVTKTKLSILLRYKNTNSKNSKSGRKRRANKRLTLQIYKLQYSKNSNREESLSILNVTMELRHTKWKNLTIPTSIVQDVYNGNENVLKLKIVCQRCSGGRSGPMPVLLFKDDNSQSRRSVRKRDEGKKKKRKPSREGGQHRNRRGNDNRKMYPKKKRPVLIVRTKEMPDRQGGGVKSRHIFKRSTELDYTSDARFRRSLDPGCRTPMMGMGMLAFRFGRGSRRIAPNNQEIKENDNKQCQIESMYVDFATLGWDWVLHPRGYHANFCDGSCRLPGEEEDVNTNRNNPTRTGITSSCCTPSMMSPLRLIYVNEHMTVLSTELDNMIVNQCKCL